MPHKSCFHRVLLVVGTLLSATTIWGQTPTAVEPDAKSAATPSEPVYSPYYGPSPRYWNVTNSQSMVTVPQSNAASVQVYNQPTASIPLLPSMPTVPQAASFGPGTTTSQLPVYPSHQVSQVLGSPPAFQAPQQPQMALQPASQQNVVPTQPTPTIPPVDPRRMTTPPAPTLGQTSTPPAAMPRAEVPAQPASQPQPSELTDRAPPPKAPVKKPDAVFADESLTSTGGREWWEFDISSYTKRFAVNAKPEEEVRRWILTETGVKNWFGPDTQELSVSPTTVRTYGTTETARSVANVLGRFLNFTPGTFNGRVVAVSVPRGRWHEELASLIDAEGQRVAGQSAWTLPRTAVKSMLNELDSSWQRSLLFDKQFQADNGQPVSGKWNARKEIGSRFVTPESDSTVEFELSPLIAQNAQDVDVDLAIIGTKGPAPAGKINRDRLDKEEGSTVSYRGLVKIPPGRILLISMGRQPSYQAKKDLLGREKLEDLLIFLDISPDSRNLVDGKPLPIKPISSPSTNSTSSFRGESAPARKPSSPFFPTSGTRKPTPPARRGGAMPINEMVPAIF